MRLYRRSSQDNITNENIIGCAADDAAAASIFGESSIIARGLTYLSRSDAKLRRIIKRDNEITGHDLATVSIGAMNRLQSESRAPADENSPHKYSVF